MSDNHTNTARTHKWRSRPAEQKRKISQAVLFGAMRQTAGVNRWQTPRQKRNAGRAPRANRRAKDATPGMNRGQTAATESQRRARAEGKPPRQNRNAGRAPMANRRDRNATPGMNRGQIATTETERRARSSPAPRFRIPNCPRRSPARTHACAGAKTGRTQRFAGQQFTRI